MEPIAAELNEIIDHGSAGQSTLLRRFTVFFSVVRPLAILSLAILPAVAFWWWVLVWLLSL
jgi:hypothetical protein